MTSDPRVLEQLRDLTARLNGDENRARKVLLANGVNLEDAPGQVARAQRPIAPSSPRPATPLERDMMDAILLEGLPEPEREYEFAAHYGRKWRADFAWVKARVMLEVQGGVHSLKAELDRDCERITVAQLLGWMVVLASPMQVRDGRAVAWAREALERRGGL